MGICQKCDAGGPLDCCGQGKGEATKKILGGERGKVVKRDSGGRRMKWEN